VTALVAVPKKTELLSASKDGVIRHWNLQNKQVIREMQHGGEVAALAVRPDGKRFASAGLNNVVKLWNGENGQMIAELKGDRTARDYSAQLERALTLAKVEVEYQKAAVDTADKSQKAETESLKKATEAKDKAEKSLAEKTDGLNKSREAKAASEKALEDLKASIAAAKEKKDALAKARDEAAAAARVLADKAAAAKTAFDAANAQKISIYQQVLDLAFQAKLAQLSALEAKTKADAEAANAALAEARKAADQSSTDKTLAAQTALDKYAGVKVAFDATAATRAEADKLLADAQAKARTATDTFAANEKIIAEADAGTRAADEKIKASTKQFADAEAAFKLAEGVKNGAVQAFDATTGALKKAGELLAKSQTDLKAAEAAQAHALQIFETARKTATETEKPLRSICFSADNLHLLWAGDDSLVHSASAETGLPSHRFEGHNARVLALTALSSGRFVSASADQSARVWNSLPSWELAQVIGDGSENSPFVDRVLALDFSPDGKLLASGGGFPSRSGEIKIWNVADGSLVRDLRDPHSDSVVALDFSPDQKFLASGGADKFLRVFNVETGVQAKSFEGHTHHVQGVTWKADGRTLASAGGDKVIKIWDFASGEQKKTIEGFGKELTSIQFLLPTKVDRNFEALASSGDTQVKVVREDGNHIRGFGGAGDFVTSATATPDGSMILAGGLDGVLRIWKGDNAQVIVNFEPPKEDAGLAKK
jgi:WD40 repeat protein